MATKKKAGAKKPASMSAKHKEAVRQMIGRVQGQVLGDFASLKENLVGDHGAKFSEDGGWFKATLLKIEAVSKVSEREALKNWCNAARRALT